MQTRIAQLGQAATDWRLSKLSGFLPAIVLLVVVLEHVL